MHAETRNVFKILVGMPLFNLAQVGRIPCIEFELGCALIGFNGGVFYVSSGSLNAGGFLAHEYPSVLKKTLYQSLQRVKRVLHVSIHIFQVHSWLFALLHVPFIADTNYSLSFFSNIHPMLNK
jgi:hypothetical protein